METSDNSMLAESEPINQESLTWCIKGLFAKDLLGEENQNALQDFLENELVLKETADVLNMRFADIKVLDLGSRG